jgi:hypothetical protein
MDEERIKKVISTVWKLQDVTDMASFVRMFAA